MHFEFFWKWVKKWVWRNGSTRQVGVQTHWRDKCCNPGGFANPLAHHLSAAQCVFPITEPLFSILVVRSGCAYDHSPDAFAKLDGFWREANNCALCVPPQSCSRVCATNAAVPGADMPKLKECERESCARACSRPPRPVWSPSKFRDLGMVARAGANPTWMMGRGLWGARVLSTVGSTTNVKQRQICY